MPSITRRSFLEHTLAVSAAGLAASQLASAQESQNKPDAQPAGRVSPNDKIGVAVIGLHGRGLDHLRGYGGETGAEVVAICDVDPSTFDNAQQTLAQRGRSPAKTYADLRKMLENPDVQTVSIAMPNHWHALAAYWAMAAGKDVYVEKPVSHNVHEGRILEQARAKFGRICQAGTQARSSSAHREAIAYIHEGHIGRVMLARGLCYKKRDSIGHFEDGSPPNGVDYDLWLGPAPLRAFNKNRFHYNWHWNWDYGNGDIGNQGVHQMDIARWALGKEMAASAISVGGRFGYEDDGQTPNTLVSLLDVGGTPLIFEVRGLKTPPCAGVTVGNIIYGTEGFVAFGEEDSSSAVAFDNSGNRVKAFKGSGNHFNNFLSAVRSRQQSDLNCPILEGHLSSTLCHLANISYRMGAAHSFDLPPRAFGEAVDMYEAFGRFEQHLADNTLSLRELSFKLGPLVAFDSKGETFGAGSAANAYLSREYRVPYDLPQKLEMSDVTIILERLNQGDASAMHELVPLVYEELRGRAAWCADPNGQTFQATALVHEAFIRLLGNGSTAWKDSKHFYHAAAEVMRQIVMNHARDERAQKRGGYRERVEMPDVLAPQPDDNVDWEALDMALAELKQLDARRYEVVMLRYFGNMTDAEVADALHVAEKTVERDWKVAKVFLHGRMAARSE